MLRAGFLLVALFVCAPSQAQTPPPALAGIARSAQEGPMQGVLVSARRSGAKVTVTVATDARGAFSFPGPRLEPGHYNLEIRAVGYELESPKSADVEPDTTTNADLKLRKASDLTTQLTSAEWLLSWPGSEAQKTRAAACADCHSLERVAKSHDDAEGFLRLFARTPHAGVVRDAEGPELAAYLAGVNLSAVPEWTYQLRTLPRVQGRGTGMIVTEYELPRKEIQPHDVIVDANGIVWYSNLADLTLGRFDPATGLGKDFVYREDNPLGRLDLSADAKGNLWLGFRYLGGIAKFEEKTGTFQTWYMPHANAGAATEMNEIAVDHSTADGRVWSTDIGIAGLHRLHLASGAFETFTPYAGQSNERRRGVTQVVTDSHNNAYFADDAAESIGRIDARTGNIALMRGAPPPARARRISIDAQDRLWVAPFGGGTIAMFDARTQAFKVWPLPTHHAAPHDIVSDRRGEAWSTGMADDRVQRLDPTTGEFVEYLLPQAHAANAGRTNERRLFIDGAMPRAALWFADSNGASIFKFEPLD